MTKYKLNVSNEDQIIQGFHVESKKDFIALRSAVEAAYLEGWHPTTKDIEEVYKYGLDPKHLKEAKKAMMNHE